MKKFPKIGQFRNLVAEINRTSQFAGLDDKGDAIYDETRPKPTISFVGTVKLHGTNAGIQYSQSEQTFRVQSRNESFPLSAEEGTHYGFLGFVKNNLAQVKELFDKTYELHQAHKDKDLVIYGEWAGKGIQKKVAVSKLNKTFFLFSARFFDASSPEESTWINLDTSFPETSPIQNTKDFKTFSIDIDFGNPKAVQETLLRWTSEVETVCPISAALGEEGVGEGIVFVETFTGEKTGDLLRFKSKGEKHAGKSKTKEKLKVSPERLSLLQKVADQVTPTWRLAQMFNDVTSMGKDIDRKHLGPYLRKVNQDIIEEDNDLIEAANLTYKDISSEVSKIARDYFFEQEKL